MSNFQGQSYLDLTVIPALRGCLLSYQPVVLFEETLQSVIWSNAPGAQLFGGNGIAELLDLEIPETNPLIRQLHYAIRQMQSDASIIRGFQINQGMRSQLLQFSIDRIEGDGSVAYKVTHLPGDSTIIPDEREAAQFAVQSLEDLASAAAILDGDGHPLAETKDFKRLSPDKEALTELVHELQAEEDRLIKRPVHLSNNDVVVIGLARLGDGDKHNLIVIVEPTESEDGEPTSSEAEEPRTSSPPSIETPDIETGETQETSEPVTETLDEKKPADDIEDDANLSLTEKPSDDQELTNQQIAPDRDVRFAWSVDQDAVFTRVSEELAALFQAPEQSLVGRNWEDLASEFDLDPDGEIAALFETRDTWSGKIVLWPIDEDGGEVAVELAALPVFDTERRFSGFRGFGKVLNRVMDKLTDGDEASSDTTEAHEYEKPDDVNEPAILISSNTDEDPQAEIDRDYEEPLDQTSNIVPFSRNTADDPELSVREKQAFETVRSHLGGESSSEPEEEQDETDLDVDADDIPRSEPPASTHILERLPVAVLVYSDDKLHYANRNFFEFSGYSSLDDLENSGGLNALLGGETLDNGNSSSVLHLASGETSVISPVLHSIPWEGGKALLLSFNPSASTIAEPADVLELTRVSEIQSILDTTNDGIILLEPDGSILSINAPAEALFGMEFNEAVGRRLEQLFAPESQATIRGYVANVIEDGIDRLINDGEEAIALESNGGIIPVFITIAKMQSTGKLCAVLRDITNWKKAEEELIQSRKQAEASNEQKSEFLAKVSHEIRTPLNAIIGFSDVMIEERFGPIDNDRYREYLLDIKRSGAHVLDIINELLDLSRIEAGKLELSFEAVNLNELVAETVALLQPEANTNRTIIRTSLSRSVPKIVADPRSIRQIILNLVSNAIKYSRVNSQVIVSTVYETNGEVALRVRDTGDGMTAEQIEEALQPFRQAHDLKENAVEGSGLGLPLTKALVEANRAYFDLESEPGLGTIAHVQFPVQRVLGE